MPELAPGRLRVSGRERAGGGLRGEGGWVPVISTMVDGEDIVIGRRGWGGFGQVNGTGAEGQSLIHEMIIFFPFCNMLGELPDPARRLR